jgi:calcineurin-like phosphoesterase family protein
VAEFLGIGDLHLSSADGSGGLSKYVQDSDQMVTEEMEKVLQYGRKHGINTTLLYGDIFDSPRGSYQGMMALSRFLASNDDFTFHIIVGNHDMYGETPATGHSLELLKLLYSKSNVKFYTKPRTIEIDGAPVRFLPYPHESFDSKALNVYHKEVRGSKNDAGRVMGSDDLTDSKAVIVAGHLHTAHRVRNTYYSGTLYQQNFGESLPKYFHHIEFNDPSDYEIRLVKHDPKYKLHTIVLSTRDDLATIPEGEFNLVKLVIQDGADVSASDYGKFSNIVMIKPFKSKEDLQMVLTEDLTEGQAVSFKTEDFFKEWLKSLDVDEELRKRIRYQRRKILNGVS